MEHTLANWNITKKPTDYDGRVTVAGIILACMSESPHYTGAIPVDYLDVME